MSREHHKAVKHGHYIGDRPSPEYYSWRSIKARCLNSKHPSYPKYGGAGIVMDATWASSFPAFLADVGPRPSLRHTIDRIKSELGYIPGNVRWATREVQNRNRSDNRWITALGETLCLEDWARRLGCSPASIRQRVQRGWTWEVAVTTPPNPKLQAHNLKRNEVHKMNAGELRKLLSEVASTSEVICSGHPCRAWVSDGCLHIVPI